MYLQKLIKQSINHRKIICHSPRYVSTNVNNARELLSYYSELKTSVHRKDFLFCLSEEERKQYVDAGAYYGLELDGWEFNKLLDITSKTKMIAFPHSIVSNIRSADRDIKPPSDIIDHLETDDMIMSSYPDIQFATIDAVIGVEYINLINVPEHASVIISDDPFNPLFFADELHKIGRYNNPIKFTVEQWLEHMRRYYLPNASYY